MNSRRIVQQQQQIVGLYPNPEHFPDAPLRENRLVSARREIAPGDVYYRNTVHSRQSHYLCQHLFGGARLESLIVRVVQRNDHHHDLKALACSEKPVINCLEKDIRGSGYFQKHNTVAVALQVDGG